MALFDRPASVCAEIPSSVGCHVGWANLHEPMGPFEGGSETSGLVLPPLVEHRFLLRIRLVSYRRCDFLAASFFACISAYPAFCRDVVWLCRHLCGYCP